MRCRMIGPTIGAKRDSPTCTVPLAQSHLYCPTCTVPLAQSHLHSAVPLAQSLLRSAACTVPLAQCRFHSAACTAACMRAVALIQSHYHRLWAALSQDHSNILRLILTHKDPTYLYMLLELVQASQASVALRCNRTVDSVGFSSLCISDRALRR
jgi:hypothetical protein